MNKRIVMALLPATALLLMASGISCASAAQTPHTINNIAPPEVGKQAPDITVTDLSGKAVSLSDFTGAQVLLNFWAVDCDGCNMERDIFEAVHIEYPDLQIMMIDSKDNISQVKRFANIFDFNLPVYMDEQMTAADDFDVHFLPETFLVDRNGIIEYIQNGAFADRAQLENALKSLQ
jgi:peroxiredoxin